MRLAPSEIMAARMTWLQKGSESKKQQDQGAENNSFYSYKEALMFVFSYKCIFFFMFW